MTSLDSVTSVFLVGMSVMLIFLESKPVMLANMSLEVKVAPAILASPQRWFHSGGIRGAHNVHEQQAEPANRPMMQQRWP
mgnify:CR=1 FL=1